jgi:DNA-binding NarL/FixJ family response regulator
MLGRDDEYVRALERAHYGHLDAGDVARAARCTWWIGLDFFLRAEGAPASGWFARGERLLDRDGLDCAERGYVRLAHMLEHFRAGDFEAARAAASEAVEIGQRFGDRDLVALGVMDQGHALLELGQTGEGLRLIDESMVAVTSGKLSPIVAGIVYCNTIAVCQGCYELRRAREWTRALTHWCESEPGMVAHQGVCLVHRAEILQLQGAWEAALDEVARVASALPPGMRRRRKDSGRAVYVQGELHRLRGDFAAAEEAYRTATRLGCEPQPGLALLRLAQGDGKAALAAIRRAVGESQPGLPRVALLQASVEIALAAREVEEADDASGELARIAEAHPSAALSAMAAHARGAVALARGDPSSALTALRSALEHWHELDAPYESARARILVGLACAELGDEDTAAIELQAARDGLEELGALPDLERLDALRRGSADDGHGLSRRELEVLRRLVSGATNREIATELVLSERTVDRHVSNLYAKLGVSSRAAATAYAYEHRLL